MHAMSLRALPLASVLLLLALTGCGGGGGATAAAGGGAAASGPDPAAVVPAAAFAYGEAVVRPQGASAAGVRTAIRKVALVANPGAQIARLIDSASEHGDTFARDIDPWLGSRIAAFALPPANTTADIDWAALVSIRDASAARAAIERFRARHEQRPAGSYRGFSYDRDVDDRSTYEGIVGDFYVAGTLHGFKAEVDAAKGAAALADDARFKAALATLDADRLAFAFLDPKQLKSKFHGPDTDPNVARMLKLLGDGDPVTLALTARADQIKLEIGADASSGGVFGEQHDGGLALTDLPGDAWLALATPALGPLIRSAIQQAGVHDAAAAQVRAVLGLDLDRDLLDSLGGLAAFARGSSVLDLGGGIELKLGSADTAAKLMTRLQALAGAGLGARSLGSGFEVRIPRSPQPIVAQRKGDRIAIGYAASSARDLLDPQQRFGDSAAGKAAIATLGDGFTPSLVLLAPPIADLLDSIDEIGIADLSKVLPYVRPYRSLAVGTQRDDDRVTVRVVAALR